MSVKLAFLATLEAKEEKGPELAEFLRAGRELAVSEEGTVTWYAVLAGPRRRRRSSRAAWPAPPSRARALAHSRGL